MVQEEHIQVTVLIIVEETGLCGITHICQSELLSPFRKSEVPIIDKKQVLAIIWIGGRRATDINIQEAVSIHVGHGGPGVPKSGSFDTRIYGYIFEFPIPFIQI